MNADIRKRRPVSTTINNILNGLEVDTGSTLSMGTHSAG